MSGPWDKYATAPAAAAPAAAGSKPWEKYSAAPPAPAGPPRLDQIVPSPTDPTGGLPDRQPEGISNTDMFLSDLGGVAGDMWTAAKGAPETALTMAYNPVVMAAAGFHGMATHPLDADAAANDIQQFEEQNLYRPRGESAQKLSGAIGEAFDLSPLKEKLGESTLNATGSPAAATFAHMLPDLGASFLPATKGAGALESVGEAIGPKAVEPVSDAVANLRAGGVKLRPSDVRAMHPEAKSIPGEFREKFQNPADLKKGLTLENQATATKRAADELGIPDLTEKSFDAAEKPHIETYQMAEKVAEGAPASPEFDKAFKAASDAAQLPKGEAYGVTRVIGALRRRANKRTASGDVKTEEAGYNDRELADNLEEQFGKRLEAAGEPQLLGEYQDARKELARINDVRGATRADQIDVAALRRMNERFGGDRLQGGLKFLADTAEYAPNVTGHSLKTASRAGDEMPSSKEGFITRGAKALVRQIPGMDISRAEPNFLERALGMKGFQEELGPTDAARSSYYGTKYTPAPAAAPQQGHMDLRQVLGLEPPPGVAGAMVRPDLGAQNLGEAFVGGEPLGAAPTPVANDLSEILGLSEPLVKKTAGKKKPRGG